MTVCNNMKKDTHKHVAVMSNNCLEYSSLLKRISQKRDILKSVNKKLKAHFVGLDNVIDRVINNMEVWYVLPEIMSQPLIINLWGMTGVGKTDLVRRLVRYLKMADNFLEIQLTTKGSSINAYEPNLQGILESSNLDANEPGILLLDEIQRFRSIDESGHEIYDYKYQDVWSLLSDGQFSGSYNSKQELLQMLFDSYYYEEREDEEDPFTPHVNTVAVSNKKKQYAKVWWSANKLKSLLKLKESVPEIMTWDNERTNRILLKKINEKKTYEGTKYSKLLIFISGNLDEAYYMSKDCEDSDVEADVFHEFSLKINIFSIKMALKTRFRPEQIARFGNIHIIYPSLSTSSYEKIIKRRLRLITQNVSKKTGIKIKMDKSIRDFLYRNGVFPAQGVRPLFSTISSFENVLPSLLLIAIENKEKTMLLNYKDDHIKVAIGKEEYNIHYPGELDKLKARLNTEYRYIIGVHEIGHALIYAKVFNFVPVQIIADSHRLSSHGSGRVSSHDIIYSKDNLRKLISVDFAGVVAEELVFGKMHATAGGSMDIELATSRASKMVRDYGFDKYVSKISHPAIHQDCVTIVNHDDAKTNKSIEDILVEIKQSTFEIIKSEMALFKDLSSKLIENGVLGQQEFQQICAKHGLIIDIIDTNKLICNGYQKRYNDFFDSELKK